MNPLLKAAKEAFGFVEQQGWHACLIGGIAAVQWGRPRATQDVDVYLYTGLGNEEHYVKLLLDNFRSRRKDAQSFALQNRVVLISSSNQVGIDIALAAFDFEKEAIERAVSVQFSPGVVLPTACAEDIIVSKAFANRPIDWMDVEGIVVRQSGKLDWQLIEHELANRCALLDDNEPLEKLANLKAKLSQ